MKFSVCLSTGYEGLVYPIPFCEPQALIKHAVLCEQLGYDGVFGNDHITTQHYVRDIFPEPPNFYDVLITLAMAGQATSKIQLGTSLLVMPMREPVYLAKQVATIDQMTNGRLILAVGLGAYREEFEAWAGNRYPNAHRGEMLDEGLAAFQCLINERVSTFAGKYYSFTDSRNVPEAEAKAVCALHRRSQHGGDRTGGQVRAQGGSPAGAHSMKSPSAFRNCIGWRKRTAAIRKKSRWLRNFRC